VLLPHAVYWYVIATHFCIPNALSQARWALSGDETFQEVGSSTGIHYFSDFEEYLTILETGLCQRKKSVINIIRQWDEKIFPNSNLSLVKSKKNNSESGLKKAMDLLAADSEEGDQMEDQVENGRASTGTPAV